MNSLIIVISVCILMKNIPQCYELCSFLKQVSLSLGLMMRDYCDTKQSIVPYQFHFLSI